MALINLHHIGKSFPGVKALDDISFDIHPGEVHGLVGENGAGKSTLIKILAGAHQPDEGELRYEGQPVHITNPRQAQAMGIATIYQEFNLIPDLTVAENVLIGREPGRGEFINWNAMNREADAIIRRLGVVIDPKKLVRNLSIAEQQMVEIAKALVIESRLIIMDEPTATLTEHEIDQLLDVVRGLRDQGVSVIFITHHLEEVLHVCDRVTVLRDGQLVGTHDIADVDMRDLIRMMVGRSIDDLFKRKAAQQTGEVALRVTNLTRSADGRRTNAIQLHNISFDVRRGEILGIAGLIGAGRTELARAIFGADRKTGGQIEINGEPVDIQSPRDAIRYGVGLVPEDRKQQALFLTLAVEENLSIAALPRLSTGSGFIRAGKVKDLIEHYREALKIRMASPQQRVRNLSGGNQQKVVIARWLALQPQILIVDEPTRGIDVAAKAEVHQLLDNLAKEGIAVVMISSELPEILSMSDRIITIREGRLTGEFTRTDATEETLMQAMMLDTAS